MSNIEPDGDLVTGPPALHPTNTNPNVLTGRHVTLVPLTQEHIPDLYMNLCGSTNSHIWRYIPNGPFSDLGSFAAAMDTLMTSSIFSPFAICSSSPVHLSNQVPASSSDAKTAISVICFMNIVPSNRSVEIGFVLFTPTLQRTTAATECIYLLMKWAFEEGKYMRVEWKANDLNEPSKRAALRVGFKFEGVFRKHMVIKGRRRDTAWFSVTDDEWFSEGVKNGIESWLDESNFVDGKQIKKLEEFRG
jgi:RimJ/RimL family protein N-acetyltransferase